MIFSTFILYSSFHRQYSAVIVIEVSGSPFADTVNEILPAFSGERKQINAKPFHTRRLPVP
jgi:hypothetical protein